jgi:cytochrome b involved in lipid metabolism
MSGKDATEKFHQFHSRAILDKQASKYKVGTIEGAESASEADAEAAEAEDEDSTYFGDLVP